MQKHNRKFIMSLAAAKGVKTAEEFAQFLRTHRHLIGGAR